MIATLLPRRIVALVGTGGFREQRLSSEPLEFVRSDDAIMLRVLFVISFEILQAIDVVHCYPERTPDARLRRVAEPVQALQTGAVRKVKARNGVERQLALLRVKQVVGAETAQFRARRKRLVSSVDRRQPVRITEESQSVRWDALAAELRRHADEPSPEVRYG